MVIKSKVARVEQSMTPFWKEERWGYNIYQNEQKQFFWPIGPLYPQLKRKFGTYISTITLELQHVKNVCVPDVTKIRLEKTLY